MKLATIWSLPALPLRERLSYTNEWMAQEIAARLPGKIRYWVTMQIIASVTASPPFRDRHPTGLTVQDILDSMEKPE